MRHAFIIPTFALLIQGCVCADCDATVDDTDTDGTSGDTDTDPGTSDTDTDTDVTGGDDTGPPATFLSGTYKATSLRVMQPGNGIDLDGDGTNDNAIASVLEAATTLNLGDFSIAAVNQRIEDMLLEERAIVLMEAVRDPSDDGFTLDLLIGMRDEGGALVVDPTSYDELGVPLQRLEGRMSRADRYEAGPAPVSLPIQLYPTDPVLTIAASETLAEGTVDTDDVTGFLVGKFTVDQIMAGIVDPLLADYFPDPEDAEGWSATVEALVALRADQTVNGQPALSGAFQFSGDAATFTQPTP